jgi:hypothetical protein
MKNSCIGILLCISVLLAACDEEKCIRFSDVDGKSVDAFIYRIDGGKALSLNPIGTLIGASKNGEVCIHSDEGISFVNDHFRIVGMGKYQDKFYANFKDIPPVVILEKELGADDKGVGVPLGSDQSK